jgi:c(7)-type cytochrome triheme protein
MSRLPAAGALLLVLGACGVALAVPPGLEAVFDGNGEGEVTFTGAMHTGPGMQCPDCHLELFDVSRSSQITRADHRRPQACFVCHDGKRAFASRGNCDRCHVEPAAPLEAVDPTDAASTPPAATP